jgi:hypothetical protein
MRAAVFLLWAMLAFPAFAQMYKCVDERGVTAYSDKPCPGGKGGAVDIRSAPPIGTTQPRGASGDLKRDEADFQRRRIQREREEEKAATRRAAVEGHCEDLHVELARLESGQRIVLVDAKGGRKEMDDAMRQSRIANLKSAINARCPR